ncbi:sulfotransferase domain-containing protein [Mycolicibacterium hippocampi]|uniref:Sulfotransferase domain-containing protein n=1 Tax=Mycolicibacterium hippocampi TaxID=659824 RepID=A0A7I9ZMQ6_9MYCO|nr:sulfotransferase domain-containing protein [Mycolicibacterium hippocampi]GFH01928.1 hypothetical protein MHIP_24110 [Mycolicibacterium hippocampi]
MLSKRFFDHSLIQRNAVLRKGIVFAREPVLQLQGLVTDSKDFATAPPIVANSLPKSGTHLLLQITRALPGSRYFGRFIATSPSLTQRERSPAVLARRIARTLPAETLGAHLFHFTEVEVALRRINALHLFIYRDPRDVVISEVNYLAEMNRWHRMHRHFAALPDATSRLKLALEGFDARYPEANARMLPYAGWLDVPGVVAIRYENLFGPRQADEIARVVAAWRLQGGTSADEDALVERLRRAVDPSKSHTFREGGSGKWRRGMTDAEAEMVSQRLAPSLTAYGYPI